MAAWTTIASVVAAVAAAASSSFSIYSAVSAEDPTATQLPAETEEATVSTTKETADEAALRTKSARARRGRASTILGGLSSGGTLTGSTSSSGTVLGL